MMKFPLNIDADSDIQNADGLKIIDTNVTSPERAAFIVKACNAHDEITQLLPDVLLYIEMNEGNIENDKQQMSDYEGGNHILNAVERLREIIK